MGRMVHGEAPDRCIPELVFAQLFAGFFKVFYKQNFDFESCNRPD